MNSQLCLLLLVDDGVAQAVMRLALLDVSFWFR